LGHGVIILRFAASVLSRKLRNLEKHRFFIEVIKMLFKPSGIGWKNV